MFIKHRTYWPVNVKISSAQIKDKQIIYNSLILLDLKVAEKYWCKAVVQIIVKKLRILWIMKLIFTTALHNFQYLE